MDEYERLPMDVTINDMKHLFRYHNYYKHRFVTIYNIYLYKHWTVIVDRFRKEKGC